MNNLAYLADVNLPPISTHVEYKILHVIDKMPKKLLKCDLPTQYDIEIHWFVPRFAMLQIACDVKTQYDYRVLECAQ